jgi:thymidylate synthase (FAD)
MNGRSMRHLLEMRASEHADMEIREFAMAIYNIMRRDQPLLLYGIERIQLPDQSEAVTSEFRKV